MSQVCVPIKTGLLGSGTHNVVQLTPNLMKIHLRFYSKRGEFAQDVYYDMSLKTMGYIEFAELQFRPLSLYIVHRIQSRLAKECSYFKKFGKQCANPKCMDFHRRNPDTYLLQYMNEFNFTNDSILNLFLCYMAAPNPQRIFSNFQIILIMADSDMKVCFVKK